MGIDNSPNLGEHEAFKAVAFTMNASGLNCTWSIVSLQKEGII